MTTERELEFLGTLGKGGFGSVYLANLHGRDQFVRRVAVKILRHAGDSDASLVARQRDEARLLGLLSHEAIVQVLDLTEIEGRPAVIMEYIEGADVGEIARLLRARSTPFSPRAAFEIVAMAAGALDVAWSSPSPISGQPLNVIHRDIKPANIVVTLRGAVKVLDFGIARAEFNREGVTQSGFFGTPAYMAPEFWVQEPIGAAYDIFALGVTLLELVTGVAPERAPMEPGRLASFMEARITPVGLPPAAASLLRAMLAFAGPERPTAGEVAERAGELAPGLPGESLPRLARALVPGLIEVRSRSLDTKDLPSRTSLGIVSGPATGPAAGEARATARGLRPDPTPTLRRGLGGPLLIGGAVVGGAALMLTSALALFAWLGWPGTTSPGSGSNVDADVASEPGAPGVAPSPVSPALVESVSPALVESVSPALVEASGSPAVVEAAPPIVPPARASHSGSTSRGDPGVVRISASPGGSTASPVAPSSPVVAAPATSGPSAPAPAPESAERAAAATAPVKRSLSLGCTIVGAALQLDGVSAGTTPRASVLVADGSHVLTASLGDRACRRTVTVGPDQPLGYICDLTTQTWSAKL